MGPLFYSPITPLPLPFPVKKTTPPLPFPTSRYMGLEEKPLLYWNQKRKEKSGHSLLNRGGVKKRTVVLKQIGNVPRKYVPRRSRFIQVRRIGEIGVMTSEGTYTHPHTCTRKTPPRV